MKITLLSFVFVILSVCHIQAQDVATIQKRLLRESESSEYSVVKRGLHDRVWERVEYQTGPGGQQIPHVHSYTELATGMHYQKDGQWMESKEEIQILPNGAGAAATQGQHKVIFPPNLYDGMIEMNTPDNKWLRSRVLGLSYFDAATGQSVLIAETKSVVGELHAPNMVIYPDAFTDFQADVRCTYTLAGFEQDIILREQPPSPKEYGLNPDTTRLQVLTEFFSPPMPERRIQQVGGMQDQRLDFGAMKIGIGRAFVLGDETDRQRGVRVMKSWQHLEGRDFLIEEVGYKKIEPELQDLPPATIVLNRKPALPSSVLHRVVSKRVLPAPQMARQETNTFQLAKTEILSRAGYVLDYVTLNAGTNDFTFRGDETYLISAHVGLSGTATFEGGAVIKFTTNGDLSIEEALEWKTDQYRPAVFTAKDDDSVGEILSGSTGSPLGYYGRHLNFESVVTLKHLRIAYMSKAITVDTFCNVSDIQVVKCQIALHPNSGGGGATVNNGLFYQVGKIFDASEGEEILRGSHLTVRQCDTFGSGDDSNIYLTNSLLVAVTNWGNIPYFTNYSIILTNDSGVFQTVGAGAHYLATNSPYRNVGTTNISPLLLANLKKQTTYPPVVSSNMMISVPTTRSPQAQRDTDIPDLGYHYEPIDWIHGDLFLTNTTLTITEGTVIASVNSTTSAGTYLFDDSSINSVGTALAPIWFVRCSSVQEQSVSFGSGYDVLPFRYGSVKPNGTFRFTKFACPADTGFHLYHALAFAYENLLIQDCEFFNGENNFSGYSNTVAALKNSLFYRSKFNGNTSGNNGSSLALSNNLFVAAPGNFTINQPSGSTWYAFNNVFETCNFPTNGTAATCTNGYNAYINCTNRIRPNFGTDIILSNAFAWQSGPLGDFYQPTNSVFINAGNVAASVQSLYHFTTLTNQVKETNSTVDIGYHYVAVNGSGQPIDTDGDGTSDYLEDANGTGGVDTGETDWQSATDMGLRVWITRPHNGSILP